MPRKKNGLKDAKGEMTGWFLLMLGILLWLSLFGVGKIRADISMAIAIFLAIMAIFTIGVKMFLKKPKGFFGTANWIVLGTSFVFIITLLTSVIGWWDAPALMLRIVYGILGTFWVATKWL